VVYREHDLQQLDDLHDHEQLALVALVRLLLTVDGEGWPAKNEALGAMADELGAERFWQLFEVVEEQHSDPRSVRELADAVKRQLAREMIYVTAYQAAMAASVSAPELEILGELERIWAIDVRQVGGPYRD
jgi:hypothetical protein